MQIRFSCIILIFLLSGSSRSLAQYSLDNFDLDPETGLSWYDHQFGLQNLDLLTGSYHKVAVFSRSTHAYYSEQEWTPIKLKYKDQIFEGINGLYDIYEDILLIQHPTSFIYHAYPIKLHQSQIEWFDIRGHHFRYYKQEFSLLEPGFYDEIYIGNTIDLLARRRKELKSSMDHGEVIFDPNDKYFLRVGDEYFRLRRKGSLLRALKPYRKEIKSYIRKAGLVIAPGEDSDLYLAVEFSDGLMSKK